VTGNEGKVIFIWVSFFSSSSISFPRGPALSISLSTLEDGANCDAAAWFGTREHAGCYRDPVGLAENLHPDAIRDAEPGIKIRNRNMMLVEMG
jgi:hypothetical protein